MNRILRQLGIAGVLAVVAAVSACSDGDGTMPAPTPSIVSGTPDAKQASAAAALETEIEAANQAADANVRSLEVRLRKERTVDDKLSLILTQYCHLGGPQQDDNLQKRAERLRLEKLYDKYWQAGGKWDRPLYAATKQQGACPDAYLTPPPQPRG